MKEIFFYHVDADSWHGFGVFTRDLVLPKVDVKHFLQLLDFGDYSTGENCEKKNWEMLTGNNFNRFLLFKSVYAKALQITTF
jgi:hypothetical protein